MIFISFPSSITKCWNFANKINYDGSSKKQIFADNPINSTSICITSLIIFHDYEPCSSYELICLQDDSEDGKQFVNITC